MNRKIKVLLIGYEAAPFFKRGGLGDVMGSLPKALQKQGVDVQVVIPYYCDIEKEYNFSQIGQFSIVFGSKLEKVSVYKTHFPHSEVTIHFLGNKKYLKSINIRGKNKKIDQFAFFDKAVVEFCYILLDRKNWFPDLIHCNDWHTALIPLLTKGEIPTLLTIHNLNYQGIGSYKVLDLLHVKDEDTKEIKRGVAATEINVLGEGILHADRVSTVSETYAKEITEGYYNHNPINKFLKRREKEGLIDGQIAGILNGIDYDVWNTKTDKFIFHPYDISGWKIDKKRNKDALLKNLAISDKPTFCFIGRMASQKGLDILTKVIDKIMALDINLILLGSGNSSIKKSIAKIAKEYPSNIRVNFVYDEVFAHKLYAGSDFILIPSHYEPCGLIQMIAMHYGTLPIASKTGGLSDTIENNINGFLFEKGNASSLISNIDKALKVYKNQDKYEKMVKTAMNADFTWDKSALLYKRLYQEMITDKLYEPVTNRMSDLIALSV